MRSEPYYNFRCRLATLCSFILLAGSLLAAAAPPDGFSVRQRTVRDGLVSNTVNRLLRGQDGYLYVGGDGGLQRFDGRNFMPVQTGAGQNFTIPVLCMTEDDSGRIWVGTTKRGLWVVDGTGTLIQEKDEFGLDAVGVRNLHMSERYGLLISSDYGLLTRRNGRIRPFPDEAGTGRRMVSDTEEDASGNLWIATFRDGLIRWDGRHRQIFSGDERMSGSMIFDLFMDGDTLYIATLDGAFRLWNTDEGPQYVDESEFTPVQVFIRSEKGEVLAGTMNNGLMAYSRTLNRLVKTDRFSGSGESFIHDILEEKASCLWAATDLHGLLQFRKRILIPLPGSEGLAFECLLRDGEGTLFAGTRRSGLYQMRETDSMLVRVPGFENSHILSLAAIHGNLFAGTSGEGLLRLTDKGLTPLRKNGEFQSVMALLPVDSALWIGSETGLFIDPKGRGETLFPLSVFNGEAVRLLRSRGDSILVLSSQGLFLTDRNGRDRKLLADAGSTESTADILLVGKGAALIRISAGNTGLRMQRGQSVMQFGRKEGLPTEHLYSLYLSSDSLLFIGSDKGPLIVPLQIFLDGFNKGRMNEGFRLLSEQSESIPALCSPGTGSRLMTENPDGHILFAGQGAILSLQPSDIPQGENLRPRIVSLRAGQNTVDTLNCTLKFHQNDIDVEVSAVGIMNGESPRFRCRLSGRDEQIGLLLDGQTRISYNNLPPGPYTFRVSVMNENGLWSEDTASLNFSILPAIPAIVLPIVLALLLLVSALAVNRYREGRPGQAAGNVSRNPVDPELGERLEERLKKLLEEDRLYLNPDLNLSDLASAARCPSYLLSRYINDRSGSNFNDFINDYRIREAAERLQSPEYESESILAIMLDCGFYSKSVFNSAFRKRMAVTPSEYRRGKRTPARKA